MASSLGDATEAVGEVASSIISGVAEGAGEIVGGLLDP